MFYRDYLRVLIPLLLALAGYRAIAVPYIEPKHRVAIPIGPLAAVEGHEPWWTSHFAADAWQRKQPKILETPQGILLFEHWDKLAPDRWKLFPLTILVPPKGQSDIAEGRTNGQERKQPLIIHSPQGAEIQFRDAIDWTSGQPPPVIGGQLNGEIEIMSPSDGSSDVDDGMQILTRDLRIDRRRVWTTQKVTMKIGRSLVEGRDLSIVMDQDLLASQPGSLDAAESPFAGLDHLELIYVDRVHIDLPAGGLFASQNSDPSTTASLQPAHAEVRCRGSFYFDFHQSLARLSSKVELRHIVESSPIDTFESDRLELHFHWTGTQSSSPSPSSARREWTIDRIEALGSQGIDPDDPTRWVRLDVPSMNARGRGRWLRVSLERGRIEMANRFPGMPPDDPSQVYLQRDSLQVWSPAIEYESERLRSLDHEGQPTTKVKRLGQLVAAGPGQASVVGEDGDTWKLSWAKSLELRPEGELDRLTVDGNANARSERQGRIVAETVDVWLKSIPDEVIAQVKSETGGYSPSSVVPDRLHAFGTVMVNFPQLRKQVADLKIWFRYPEIESAQRSLVAPSSAAEASGLKLVEDPRRFTQQPSVKTEPKPQVASPLGTAFSNLAIMANGASTSAIDAPPSIAPTGPGQLANTSLDRPSMQTMLPGERLARQPLPLNVTGETLVAKVSHSSRGLVIDDLALTNNVTVTRDQVSDASSLPLTIIGHQVLMDSQEEGKLDITIVGAPAKVAIGSGGLESTEIHCNQAKQLVWMEQPGILRIPVEALRNMTTPGQPPTAANRSNTTIDGFQVPGLMGRSNAAGTSSESNSATWIEAPEVQWKGRMVFDGRVVKMDGGIRLTGRMKTDASTLWHLDLHAQEMVVELEQPVDFMGENPSPAKVAIVRMLGNVDLKAAQTDITGKNLRSREHLEVPELAFLIPQQQWVGTGPGSLRSRRIGNATPGSPQEILTGIPSEPTSAQSRNPQAELQCLHLRFQGRMDGDLGRQMVTFQDHVEVLLQPIVSWDQTPEVHLIDQVKMGQTHFTCDQLSVYNTSQLSWNQSWIQNHQLSRDAAWEVAGIGRVVVESVHNKGAFTLQANRVQYVALHSMLRLEGSPADLKRTSDKNPSAIEELKLTSGAINLKTGDMELAGVRGHAQLGSDASTSTIPTPAGASPAANLGGYGQPSSNSPSLITSPRDTPLIPRRDY